MKRPKSHKSHTNADHYKLILFYPSNRGIPLLLVIFIAHFISSVILSHSLPPAPQVISVKRCRDLIAFCTASGVHLWLARPLQHMASYVRGATSMVEVSTEQELGSFVDGWGEVGVSTEQEEMSSFADGWGEHWSKSWAHLASGFVEENQSDYFNLCTHDFLFKWSTHYLIS